MRVAGICRRLLRRLLIKSFSFWQRLGLNIIPNHFYQPIPDIRTLKDDLWSKHSELVGIDINEKKQLELLSFFVSNYRSEYDKFPKDKPSVPYQYYINNGSFRSVDGEILYCMIRHFKPRRILEIGSGYSTFLSAQAILENSRENSGYECKLKAIEPYPNDVLKAGFPGLSELIPKQAQNIPLSEFEKLKDKDILFIDSSHVLKIGSDVQYQYLEVLPRLNKGVIVHVHDIFLPAEYPKGFIFGMLRFFNEQYILQAFLSFNNAFEVLWASNYMHLKHPDSLENAFTSYRRDGSYKRNGERWWIPHSFWMRRVE